MSAHHSDGVDALGGAVMSGGPIGIRGTAGPRLGAGGFHDLGSPEAGVAARCTLFDARAATEHLNYLYGDHCESGVMAMAFGAGWNQVTRRHARFRQAFYEWPDDIDTMTVAAEAGVQRREDVYLCPRLRAGRERRKVTGVTYGNVGWVDLDDEADDETIRRLGDAGVLMIESGSAGHFHVYPKLSEFLPVGQIEDLNNHMAAVWGGDSKWSNESLLRLAGTRNFKSGGDGQPVTFLVPPDEAKVFSLDELNRIIDAPRGGSRFVGEGPTARPGAAPRSGQLPQWSGLGADHVAARSRCR